MFLIFYFIFQILQAFGTKIPIDNMISLYTHLLKDVEGEVRDVAASKLQGILILN